MDKILKIIEEVTMKKCRYCGKELDSNLEFCSSECENSYRKIIEKDRHKIKYFISSIILGFLAMFYGVKPQLHDWKWNYSNGGHCCFASIYYFRNNCFIWK